MERWHAEWGADQGGGEDREAILSPIRDAGVPQMPSSIAAALAVPRECAKAMRE